MKKISFTKMVASGNDFIIVEARDKGLGFRDWSGLAKKLCDRKYGIGADGLLLLEKSKKADIKMRIFNADGSEAEMCGNGARCAALYSGKKKLSLETKAGIINSEVNKDNVKIKLTDPKNIKLDIPIKVGGRILKINFIDTGVPHAVIFVEGLGKMNIVPLGRYIRYHKAFAPRGTNVDFIEVVNNNTIKIRTYERGVEDETLACGTGSVAAAITFALKSGVRNKISVNTQGGERLKVYFERVKDKFRNVWLEGKARRVYDGKYYL